MLIPAPITVIITADRESSPESWTMKLYLMQHGDALQKDVDPDRPLSPRGRRDIEKIAAFLHRIAGINS